MSHMNTVTRRNLITTGVAFAAGSRLFGQANTHRGPVGGPVKPTIAGQLLRESAARVFADVKANNPNAARINLLAGQLSMLSANMADDGTLALAQAAWHPRTLIWTAQDTTNLVASAATAGVVVDPALFRDTDQLVQNQRDSFPLQVPDIFTSTSAKLLADASAVGVVQARRMSVMKDGGLRYEQVALHLHGIHPQVSCPYGSGTIALLMTVLAASLAAAGLAYAAAAIAAIAAVERLLDAFTNCNDRLGG